MENLLFKTPSFPRFGSTHKLRVADILSGSDDDDSEAVEMDSFSRQRKAGSCSSPRRLFARFLQRFREKRGPEQSGKEPEETRSKSSDHRLKGNCERLSSLSLNENESERCRNERNFNLGIGVGLLYLIAASKNELDKMVKLRKRMEMFFENAKGEVKREDIPPNHSEASEIFSCSNDEAHESSNNCSHHSQPSYSTSDALPGPEAYMVFDHSSKCDGGEQLKFVEGMDQLESELEAELERLQLDLDAERSSECPQRQWREEFSMDIADASSSSSGEVIDPRDTDCVVQRGIPPRELERKLHEVLEGRQQERIKELEAALECAMHKLQEKHLEVSWWKDTARIIYRHISETSRPSSQGSLDTFGSPR